MVRNHGREGRSTRANAYGRPAWRSSVEGSTSSCAASWPAR